MDVIHALAQRGHLDRKDIQPVKKILAERACSHGGFQIAVRGGQHAYVHGNRLTAADPFDFPLLEYSQERNLSLSRKVADLIQKNRSTISQLKSSQTPLERAGEGAFFVPEQFGGNERRRNRRAIDSNKSPRRTFRPLVNGARDQLLTSPGLT